MHRVLMNYQWYRAYTCRFIEAGFYHRCNPDDLTNSALIYADGAKAALM